MTKEAHSQMFTGYLGILFHEVVTKQREACSCGAFVHDPTISIGRTGLYLQYPNLGGRGLRTLMLRALLSHETQHFCYSPKGDTQNANTIVPYIPNLSHLHNSAPVSLEGTKVTILT